MILMMTGHLVLGAFVDATVAMVDHATSNTFVVRRRTETMQDAELQRLGWCLDGLPCSLTSS